MNGFMFWSAVVLAALNLAAVALWLGTVRLRFVLSMGRWAFSRPRRSESPGIVPTPPSIDPVEQQLVDDIRAWRSSRAGAGAEPDPGGLEHWIAEVDRDERRTGGGFLPGSRRDPAGSATSPGGKRPWRAISSMARTLTGS